MVRNYAPCATSLNFGQSGVKGSWTWMATPLPRRWDPAQTQKPDPPGGRSTAGFTTRNLKGRTIMPWRRNSV
jgi:hypothetical protein